MNNKIHERKKKDMSKKSIFLIVTAILIIGFILSCRSLQPNRSNYNLPPTLLKDKEWKEIMSARPKIDSFKILNTGSVKVPLDGMLNTKKLKANHGLEKQLWVDVFVFLFHHADRGWFMIDTGLDSSFQKKGNIKGLLSGKFIKDSKQEQHQNIGSLLEQENKNIEGIFFTHLHGDHTAGLPEINPSIPKYAGKGEKFINLPILYNSNHLSNKDNLIEIDYISGIRILPLETVIDIFGDGSFLGVHTPGHSASHLSFILMTDEGAVLLTGDASHTKYGFENKIEPGWVDDRELAEHSLNQLIEFHEKYPEVKVVYGHEE